jgi:hypothetical protein
MNFDEADLKEIARHLAFEIHHFRCYATLYQDRTLGTICPAARQAVIYALLLHLRSLYDFFYAQPRYDDCSVIHFKDVPGFQSAFALPVPELAPGAALDVKGNLNKRLAHLTATRWRDQTKPMDYCTTHIVHIEGIVQNFERALPHELKLALDAGFEMWEHHVPTVRAMGL